MDEIRLKGHAQSAVLPAEEEISGGRQYGGVIDVHIHPKLSEEGLLGQMAQADVSAAVLLSADTDPGDLDREGVRKKVMALYRGGPLDGLLPFDALAESMRKGVRSPGHIAPENLIDWIERYPDRFVGFGSVDLCKSQLYVERKLNDIKAAGLTGVKLYPFSQFFNPNRCANMELLCDFCEKNSMIISCHTGCAPGIWEVPSLAEDCNPKYLKEAALRHPGATLIMAHFGSYSADFPGLWLDEALDVMACCDNAWADTAAVAFLFHSEDASKKIRRRVGFDRVLFGSDFSGLPGRSLKMYVKALMEAPYLSETEKEKIMAANARRILKLYRPAPHGLANGKKP